MEASRMTISDSYVAVDSYRRAAQDTKTAVWNYKGLAIHALPEIHQHVGMLVGSALPPAASVLDLAAGSGAMCARLRDLGFTPVGTDIVHDNFRLHGEIEFVGANLNEKLPPALTQRFDCVTALELIEHIENPRHLLRQCFAALKPGGMLVVSTPNLDSPLSQAQFLRTGEPRWFMDSHYKVDGHITPVPRFVLARALAEAGFCDVAFETIAPPSFAGLAWWKMRLLAAMLSLASGRSSAHGDILLATARRPAAS
jgi:2-polyprenyl-3-methyl-5-hydroxy-6-metoxy-1,4-benzoquinol methylase